jgi:hypothetical protein
MGRSVTPERIRKFIVHQKLDFLIDATKTPSDSVEAREALKKNRTPEPESQNPDDEASGKSFKKMAEDLLKPTRTF